MSKKSYKIRRAIAHAFDMKTIGPCTVCHGTAKVDGMWCTACAVTGRRDKQIEIAARLESSIDGGEA